MAVYFWSIRPWYGLLLDWESRYRDENFKKKLERRHYNMAASGELYTIVQVLVGQLGRGYCGEGQVWMQRPYSKLPTMAGKTVLRRSCCDPYLRLERAQVP